jgi:hypothetical protein
MQNDLKRMVFAPVGNHVVPAVILYLGGDKMMENRRMASVLLSDFSLPRYKNRASVLTYSPLLS